MSLRPKYRRAQPESLAESDRQTSRIPSKASLDSSRLAKPAHDASNLPRRVSRSNLPVPDTGRQVATRTQSSSAATQSTSESRRRLSNVPIRNGATPDNDGLYPPSVMRTPSLISGGSSVSTFDSPRSHGLRRKPSGAIDKYAAQKRADSASVDEDRRTVHVGRDFYGGDFENSVLGISLPPTSAREDRANHANMQSRPDHLQHPPLSRLITPPIVSCAPSATPSTRYTDSPFSHVPTPSSASSYSPAISAFAGSAISQSTSSPTQIKSPTGGRRNVKEHVPRPSLGPVRESSLSSTKSSIRIPETKISPIKQVASGKTPIRETDDKPSDARRTLTRNKLTKGKPTPAASRTAAQSPPELAHLNVDPPPSKSPQKPPPPSRPSRFGTPNLSDMNTPSPVVQSDLPRLYTTYHKRNISSQGTPISAESPNVRSRLGFSPKQSSSKASPRIDSAISPPPSLRDLSCRTTPEPAAPAGSVLRRKGSLPVTTVSPAKSRFGFFSRKSKTESAKTSEKPKRQQTKGLAAGTGHEGYARFGIRRSGSIASSTGVRSPSTGSSTSTLPLQSSSRKGSAGSKDAPDMDDFFRERLNPVILRGSGGNSQTTVSSYASSLASTIAVSQMSASVENIVQPQLLPSALQKSREVSPDKSAPFSSRRKMSDSSEDDVLPRRPKLTPSAAYRSDARRESASPLPSLSKSNVALGLPMNDLNDTKLSTLSDIESVSSETVITLQEAQWFGSKKTQSRPQVEPKRNFTQRAQASPQSKKKARTVTDTDDMEEPHRSLRPALVAHYTLADFADPVDLKDVEQIMQENETSAEESTSESFHVTKVVPYEDRHVGLLPAPPKVGYGYDQHFGSKLLSPRAPRQPQQSPEQTITHPRAPLHEQKPGASRNIKAPVEVKSKADRLLRQPIPGHIQAAVTPEMQQGTFDGSGQDGLNSSPRRSRLSPVGRIPRVISKRDRDRKLPDNSFSRPFARAQPRPSVKPPGSVYSQIRDMASPTESAYLPVATATNLLSLRSDDVVNDLRARNGLSIDSITNDLYSSDEFLHLRPRKDSGQSFSSSSGYPSWTAATDVQQMQQEDEWNEYNDLMDDMNNVTFPRNSATASSFVAPLPYIQASQEHYPRSYRIPSLVGEPPSIGLPLPPGFLQQSTALSLQQQVAKFLQPSLSPLSPDRYSGGRFSFSSIQDSTSSRYSHGSAHSRSTSLPEANLRNSQVSFSSVARFNRDARLLDIAEVEAAQESCATKLRVPALMTSKWLSFGRILFSPAHNEMSLAENPRVLVVDELSSDWSHFVALAYPSATVYNLTRSALSSQCPHLQQPLPSNHRQIPLSPSTTPFPFPKGFFNVVVFRFPKATTEQTYQSSVSECKRVLRPGGFLEVVVLDLDLMNMGVEARRALRGLKTRMQQRDREVCLSNLSDVLVRLIGRRGFEAVQRCVVGIPTAGRIPRSQDSSSVSSDGVGKPSRHAEDNSDGSEEFSFADLLDQTRYSQIGPVEGTDESITKMVAKVGRWWYSSCYEKSLLPTDQSIWKDRALLRECEKQGTSFRLLICHAQKPTQPRRRTVSV